MGTVTKQLLKTYNIKQGGLDFMGYKVDKLQNVSYHHLLIPARQGGEKSFANGCILMQGQGFNDSNSHDYLHLIERFDYELFCHITSEILDQKIKGYLDLYNLRKIHSLLEYFESEDLNMVNSRGKLLLKPNYLKRPDL